MVRVLRVILAGVITLGALLAGFLAAVVILFTGVVGFVLQLFRSKPQPGAVGPTHHAPGSGEVIDVVATKVPDGDQPPLKS